MNLIIRFFFLLFRMSFQFPPYMQYAYTIHKYICARNKYTGPGASPVDDNFRNHSELPVLNSSQFDVVSMTNLMFGQLYRNRSLLYTTKCLIFTIFGGHASAAKLLSTSNGISTMMKRCGLYSFILCLLKSSGVFVYFYFHIKMKN